MMMTMKTWIGVSAMACCLMMSMDQATAQLESCYREHGGLDRWRFYGAVRYDLTWQMGDRPARVEHHLIALRDRHIVIKSDSYTIGFDGTDCWVAPNLGALQGPPARFWVSTPFYFFGTPFVFADPGVKLESLGSKMYKGREHDVVKVTYKEGIGDTPEDDYVVYVDRLSRQVRLVHYIVTYPALRQGKPIEELERHALVFEEWTEADRLVVPAKGTFYNWKDGDTVGQPIGTVRFDNVKFGRVPPAPSAFQKPAEAEIDTSLGK